MKPRILQRRAYSALSRDFMLQYNVITKFVYNWFEDGEVAFPFGRFYATVSRDYRHIDDDITDPDHIVDLWSLDPPGTLQSKTRRPPDLQIKLLCNGPGKWIERSQCRNSYMKSPAAQVLKNAALAEKLSK